MFSDSHLSERDQAVIEAIHTFYQLTGEQIERLFFSDGAEPSRTGKRNRMLRRLVKWNEVKRIEERAIGGWASGSHGYVYVPVESTAQLRDTHTLNIAELYVQLMESSLEVIQYEPEAKIHGLSVQPDADVRVKRDGRTFHFYAEVEYSRKTDERVKTKLLAYERAAKGRESFPLVLWLAASQTRVNAIQRVIDSSKDSEIFQVVLFDEAISYLEG